MRDCRFALLFLGLVAATASSQQSSTPPGSPSPTQDSKAPAQSKKADKTPSGTAAEKAADALKSDSKTSKYLEESFVIEQMHSYYRFEADGTGRKETKARIRVQSEAGVQQRGQLQEGYNSANEDRKSTRLNSS